MTNSKNDPRLWDTTNHSVGNKLGKILMEVREKLK